MKQRFPLATLLQLREHHREAAQKAGLSLRVQIADTEQTVPAIVQRVIAVDAARRAALLRHLIQQHGWKRVLVFVATQHAAESVGVDAERAEHERHRELLGEPLDKQRRARQEELRALGVEL